MSEKVESGITSEESSAEDVHSTNNSETQAQNSVPRVQLGEQGYKIPIIGYEVMEERAKFTVFKLKVEPIKSEVCWFVFRRYTDFVRFYSKLRADYPTIGLTLPKKKWFGDNFDNSFLTERIEGLQGFVNQILNEKRLLLDNSVRNFFCMDEPPSVDENVEESKAVLETLEERIYQLQRQLKEQEVAYERLKTAHSVEISAKLRLAGFVQECTKQCPACAARLAEFTPIAN